MTAEGAPTYRTGIGTSTADEITLLGQDLAHDLIGKITFGDLAFRLVAKREPTPQELTMFEAVLSHWPTTASPRPRSPPG